MDSPPNESASHRLQWFGRTDRGHVRKNNEDTFLALQFDALEVHYLGKIGEAPTGNADFVFAVSDGMGGAKAGELASRITVDKITHLLPRSFKQSVMGLHTGFEDIFTELFDQIHRALTFLGSSDEEVHGMQATLSLCDIAPDPNDLVAIGKQPGRHVAPDETRGPGNGYPHARNLIGFGLVC